MLESFNLMNLGSSVDNTATFAASSSSAALNSTSAAQSALFHQATTLSFNEHLTSSINESQQQQLTATNDEASKLAMQIVKLLLEQQMQSDQGQSEEAVDESQIADASAQLLEEHADGEHSDVSLELTATVEKLISELPAQQRSQFETVLSDIKSILAGESTTDTTLEHPLDGQDNQQASVQMLSEMKSVIAKQLEALNVLKHSNQQNTELAQLIDSMQAMNKQLADLELSDANATAELSQQITQLIKQVEQFAGNNRELTQAVSPIREKLSETISALSKHQEVDVDSDSIVSQPIAVEQLTEKEKGAADKLATIISQLSSEERRQFKQIVSQAEQQGTVKIEPNVVADTQTAKQIIAQIEQSRASLQPVNQTELTEEKQAPVSGEQKSTNAPITNITGDPKLAKPTTDSEKGVNVKTSDAITIEEPVKLEGEASAPKGANNKVDALVSQLEASFRNNSNSNTPADSQAASVTRVEQQVAKELNSSQITAQKTPENIAQRITLNDNSLASQQIKEHMTMMMRGGIGHAVLNLDPEELGAMSVRIVMQHDQMNVQFQVSNPQAKDMLEQAMAKLKESLQEQGIALNQSDVKEQNQQQKESQGAQERVGLGNQADPDEGDPEPISLVLNKQSTNGIDYYA